MKTCRECERKFEHWNAMASYCPECKARWDGGWRPAYQLTPKVPVVYMLWVDSDPRVYIGKTTRFEHRLRAHMTETNPNLARARGDQELRYSIVATLDNERDMTWLEQVLRHFAPEGTLYNSA